MEVKFLLWGKLKLNLFWIINYFMKWYWKLDSLKELLFCLIIMFFYIVGGVGDDKIFKEVISLGKFMLI